MFASSTSNILLLTSTHWQLLVNLRGGNYNYLNGFFEHFIIKFQSNNEIFNPKTSYLSYCRVKARHPFDPGPAGAIERFPISDRFPLCHVQFYPAAPLWILCWWNIVDRTYKVNLLTFSQASTYRQSSKTNHVTLRSFNFYLHYPARVSPRVMFDFKHRTSLCNKLAI